jgi:hypothetical protein
MLMPTFFPLPNETRGSAPISTGGTWNTNDQQTIHAMRYVCAVSQLIQQSIPDIEPSTLPAVTQPTTLNQTGTAITIRLSNFPRMAAPTMDWTFLWPA